MDNAWRGVFPAVTTKMTKTGQVDLKATQHSIARLIENGVSGVVVVPMLGEAGSLLPSERESVIRAAIETADGRVPVLSGLAESTLEAAKTNARAYERLGVQGLMVFPSLGYKTDAHETAAWYAGIASASTLPIMIYNNPGAYRVDVTREVLDALTGVEEVVCVKEECGDTRRITDLRIAFGDRFALFCGVDDLLVESVAVGATGWVSGLANAWPRECIELFDLCMAEKFTEARELYRVMMPALHLDTHVKLVQCIKLAEHLIYDAPEWTRPPRLALTGDEREFVTETVAGTTGLLEARRR